jgi:phosphoribosyl 1,2-cyclic phosphodiesterase
LRRAGTRLVIGVMDNPVTFCILGSSSQGNCGLLITPNCRVLIDIGFPARRLNEMLEPLGVHLRDIDAIFITHEHSDHVSGLSALAKHPHIQVFANRETARVTQERLNFRPTWQFFETGSTFVFRDLEICTFSIPHDAADPVGFVFAAGSDADAEPRRRLAWCTDLGYVPELVRERIRGADVLVIESNYDADLLDRDERRPWALKQRIKSRHGHLSNDATHELLRTTEGAAWRRVFLAHLSRDCNDVTLVRQIFSSLSLNGHKFSVDVVDPRAEAIGPFLLAEI